MIMRITISTNKIREVKKIMGNKFLNIPKGGYVEAGHTASKTYPNHYDVICGNCEKMTNVFIIEYDTGFVEGIYFYCPHCGELNRYYSV